MWTMRLQLSTNRNTGTMLLQPIGSLLSLSQIKGVNDEAPTFNQQEYRYYLLLQPMGSLLAYHNQRC
jgi:hypothetical protein